MKSDSTTVTGEILFDESTAPPPGATVHVLIEDVSRADTAAVEIARLDIPNVTPTLGQTLTFEISADEVNPHAHYQVRVHVDTNHSGRISPGDQVSVENVPVLTQGHPNRVRVCVRKV
ncbi:YbaY family lipoprotein [Nocardia gipuzkoensis]